MIRTRIARALRSLADAIDRPAIEQALDNLYAPMDLSQALRREAAARMGVADEMLADGHISPSQHARMVGKPGNVAPHPTTFQRKRDGWRK